MPTMLPTWKSESIVEQLNNLHDRIMYRAYEIFEGKPHISGNELENWLQAESELVWRPAIELEELDKEIRLKIALPGVDPKDIHVEVTPEDILVKADIRHEHAHEGEGKVHICEFTSRNVFRSIHLPVRIDPDKVNAEFENGLLRLTAEIEQRPQSRPIELQAAS